MASYKDGVLQIAGSIHRGKGSFNVSESPKGGVFRPFAITLGSHQYVSVPGGTIISMDLSRDQLSKLRDMCDELLKRGD